MIKGKTVLGNAIARIKALVDRSPRGFPPFHALSQGFLRLEEAYNG